MGVLEVEVVRRSPSGDPTAYRIRGAVIALRRDQVRQVRVERLHKNTEVA